MSYLSLRDYGLIGNQESAVLVSRAGSIDWCCLPYLDSPSHFGSLLDDTQGGQFQIAPQSEYRSEQNYVTHTNVLETHFETATGRAILSDWMPVQAGPSREPAIYRRLEVIEGSIAWQIKCSP